MHDNTKRFKDISDITMGKLNGKEILFRNGVKVF